MKTQTGQIGKGVGFRATSGEVRKSINLVKPKKTKTKTKKTK